MDNGLQQQPPRKGIQYGYGMLKVDVFLQLYRVLATVLIVLRGVQIVHYLLLVVVILRRQLIHQFAFGE